MSMFSYMFEQADAKFDDLVARVAALETAVAEMTGRTAALEDEAGDREARLGALEDTVAGMTGGDFEDRLTALEARPRINVIPAATYDPTEALPTDVLTVLVGTVAEVRNLQPDEAPADEDTTFTIAVGFDDDA